MKFRAAALSIVSVLATVAATPAMAQYWYAPGPYAAGPYADPYGGPRPYYARGSYGYEGISPYEVGAIVRSANLQPISRPWRNGANFVVRAINLRGGTVRVVIDGYRGRILAITPAEMAPTARLAPDPRRDGTAAEYDADGNLLPPRPVPNVQRPVTKQQRPAVEHKRTAAVTPVHPPLPRPRPADAPSPVVAVKPAPDTPAAPAAATPPPAPETVPQPTETPAGAGGSTTSAAPSAGSGASFPPVTPLE